MSAVAKSITSYAAAIQSPAVHKRNRILCLSDLHSRSEPALHRASALARAMRSDLLVLHVLSGKHSEDVLSSEDRNRLSLSIGLPGVVVDAEQPAAVQIRRGDVFRVIKEVAREWNPGLLVVAAPVRKLLERLTGSGEERLIAAVNCPVLMVRSPALKQYTRIAVATDLETRSEHAVRKVSELGFFAGAEVVFVHAFPPPYEGINLGDRRAAEQLENFGEKMSRLVDQELTAYIASAGLTGFRTRARSRMATQPEHGLAAMLLELGSELLVMTAPRRFAMKRLLNRSTTHRILRRIDCDMLVVPQSRSTGTPVKYTKE
jgi:nucleotide-binding universal stress UspA family protein